MPSSRTEGTLRTQRQRSPCADSYAQCMATMIHGKPDSPFSGYCWRIRQDAEDGARSCERRRASARLLLRLHVALEHSVHAGLIALAGAPEVPQHVWIKP